jgi:phosphoglycolate phosphatase
MNPNHRHLFLDLDGILIDPAPGIVACYRHVAERLGLAASAHTNLQRFIGPPLRVALAELIGTDDRSRIEQAVELYRERFAEKGLYENAVYAGIPAVLAGLPSSGYQLWIVTSKAKRYADEIARHFEMLHHFSGIYGAEMSGERSDKAELIAHLLAEQRIEPSAAVMIGDRRHDIAGAKAHAMLALGALWGYGSREELVAAGADALVTAVSDLPAAIERIEWR